MNIKISIVLPVYNSERYLHKCLESILIQNIKDIEIIAINDCSTDNSLEILNQYSSQFSKLRIISHAANMGAGTARNNAIREATGEYITFIDSDDWFGDNYLNCLYNKAEETHADIVFSNMAKVDNRTIHEFDLFYKAFDKYNDSNAPLIDLPCDWRPTAPWMKLFRRDFVINNKLVFLEGITLGEDISFSWSAYFVANRISFCENAYYYYNISSEGHDRRVNNNIIEIFNALEFTKSEFHRLDPSHSRQSQLDTLYVSHTYYQFSKLTNAGNIDHIELTSLYWNHAHKCLGSITQDNIINNNCLYNREKEYYFDVIRYPCFNSVMQNKYLMEM